MKRTLPSEGQDRFSGNLRHYHRSGAPSQRSWDDWVEGDQAKTRSSKNWLKIIAVMVALLGLGGIIIGLLVELA